jgi:hypothetical protein
MGSNFQHIGYSEVFHGFPQTPRPRFGLDRFLQHQFQSLIHKSSNHPTLPPLDAQSVVKYPTREISSHLWPGFDSRHGEDISFSTVFRPALGPIQLVPGALSTGVNRPEREADHSHLVPRLRMVELYRHSLICLHGIVLN